MTTNQALIATIVYISLIVCITLGIAYTWVKAISKDEYVPSEHSCLTNIRVKIYLHLLDETSRYKAILPVLTVLWLLGKCLALANELAFAPSLNNQEAQSFAIAIIVTTNAISEILGFLVAATIVKLYVDYVNR